jgi:uncharacterized membrane protein YkvA (DUF1232 family)
MIRWWRLWRLAENDLRLLGFALQHPGRPLWLIPATAILVFYALEPLNFVVPLFGIVDEFILLPVALHVLLKFLPTPIREGYATRATLEG